MRTRVMGEAGGAAARARDVAGGSRAATAPPMTGKASNGNCGCLGLDGRSLARGVARGVTSGAAQDDRGSAWPTRTSNWQALNPHPSPLPEGEGAGTVGTWRPWTVTIVAPEPPCAASSGDTLRQVAMVAGYRRRVIAR